MPESCAAPSLSLSLEDLFTNPPADFRGKPFWSWNGKLETAELLRQVGIFKEMGMGGFFMHSRTGLKTEYLGPEWFECINACADEAARLGMKAWLYDEDRWPSGSAGGLATEDPRYRMKVMRLQVLDAAGFRWPEEKTVAAAFAVRLEGLDFTDATRLSYGSSPPDDGRKLLLFTIEAWTGHSFYNGNTYLDTLSAEATRHFLEITHEQYRRHCGDRLGNSIAGIFTDEPHRGTVMCENNENRAMADQSWTAPWTETLWDEFQTAWGYDLRDRLPELFLFPEGRRVSAVKWHYMELLQRLFLRNWAEPLHTWCKTHGLQLTGHVLHEDSLAAQAVPCGSVMRYYEYLDVPGIDLLALHNHSYWVAKQVVSVARQMGRKWILSEMYGCTGWQLDFAGHKRIGAWQSLLGINVRCHHLAWMTMEGEAKRDYPASIHFQSSWYRQYAALEDYFARMHVLLQQGSPVCDVLVVNPIESTWVGIHPGWAKWLGAVAPEMEKLEQTYQNVFRWLTSSHLDFDYGDEEHLRRFGRVETNEPKPVVRLGEMRYRVVVVAGMTTIRKSTLRLLSEFATAGGALIFAGTPPDFVEAEPSEGAWKLASRATEIPLEETALAAAVRQASEQPIEIIEEPASRRSDLLCQIRRDGEKWIVALLNTSEERPYRGMIRLAAPGPVQEWRCDSGERRQHESRSEYGKTIWQTELPPLGEKIFVVGFTETCALQPSAEFHAAEGTELHGPFAYSLDEPNLCVLDSAEYRIGTAQWEPAQEILRVDEALRQTFGFEQRSGVMIQPWASTASSREVKAQPVTLRFRFDVWELPAQPVMLVMENPGSFQIRVNDQPLPAAEESGWFIDPCFKKLPLPEGGLRQGPNEITITMDFHAGTELEAIYLAGDFGVSVSSGKPVIGALPERLTPGDITTQGLPFYSGKITYRLPLAGLSRQAAHYRLELGQFGGAAAAVRVSENAAPIMVAWPPYEADLPDLSCETEEVLCDIWLTRRNTFGPLHLLPREQPHIGPMSFRSKDSEFTEDYVLIPSGLLVAPRLVAGS